MGPLNSGPNSPLAESEQHALRLYGPDVGVWNHTCFILENVRSRDWLVSIRQLFWSDFCLLQNQSSSQQASSMFLSSAFAQLPSKMKKIVNDCIYAKPIIYLVNFHLLINKPLAFYVASLPG